MDMDVNSIFKGYLRGAKAKGATLTTGAEATTIERKGGKWLIATPAGTFGAGGIQSVHIFTPDG